MRRLAFLAAFLIAACGSLGAQAHTLSLAYKPGDNYKYSLHAVLKLAQELNAQEVIMGASNKYAADVQLD